MVTFTNVSDIRLSLSVLTPTAVVLVASAVRVVFVGLVGLVCACGDGGVFW